MKIRLFIYALILITFLGCSKSFLEEKPDANIVNPKTLSDCRRLLDNDGRLGQGLNFGFPSLGQLASDEYYYDKATWESTVFVQERNCYIWEDDIYEGNPQISEWNSCYYAIYICNVVLDVLEDIKVTEANRSEYNDIKGTALFFRAIWNFALAETFCLPYDKTTALTEFGIPLRFSPNIDQLVQRSTLEETYKAILDDLHRAVSLLQSETPPMYRNRPSVSAANAMLARIYLVMGNYELALEHADRSYSTYQVILDYNTLPLEGDAVFDRNNGEILFMAAQKGYISTSIGRLAPNTYIDSALMALYDTKDLRLQAYFTFDKNNRANRKSLYTTGINSTNLFNGVATDEVLLILAECKARTGDLGGAKILLENLYKNRFSPADIPPVNFENSEDAIQQVLDERRKELLFRGMRWSDVRRLNVEGRNISFKRKLGDKEYILQPRSLKYAFLLPAQEIQFSSLIQNKR